jgi:hypothetical protein
MSEKLWATPRSYSFNASHTPGLTTLDCQARGLYLDKERYHGKPNDSPQLTLFAEDFPVSPTPLLADVPAPTTSAISGPNTLDSFANLDPDGSWRKTCQGYSQVTLDGSLERFSETWPRAGMTRNGIAYRRQPSAPLTDVIVSGLWPTPDASCGERGGTPKLGPRPSGAKRYVSLNDRVRQWPTPTARDHKSDSCSEEFRQARDAMTMGKTLPWVIGGLLNPTWVEWLMGYPLGWTVCEAWATRSSRKSRNGSPTGSKKRKG